MESRCRSSDKIILAQEVHMAPGGGGAVRHGVQKCLPLHGVFDLGEFLCQVQIIPADDAVLMSRLQASTISWSSLSACRNSWGLPTDTARVKRCTCSIPLSTFSMAMRSGGSSMYRRMKALKHAVQSVWVRLRERHFCKSLCTFVGI